MKEKKPVYIRCPRCELNYIQKKDKFCNVCKVDMQANSEYVDELSLEICPICKTNYIQPDELVCATCLKERQHSPGFHDDMDEDEWNAYIDRDEEDVESPEEETGEMASVTSFEDEDADLDDDLTFDDDDELDLDEEDEEEDVFDEDDEDDDDDEEDDEEDDDFDEDDDF